MVPSEWGHPKRGDGWRVRPADPPKSTGSSETLVSCRAEPGQGLVLKPQRVVPYQEACFQLAGSEQAGLYTRSRELRPEGADDVRVGQMSMRRRRSSHHYTGSDQWTDSSHAGRGRKNLGSRLWCYIQHEQYVSGASICRRRTHADNGSHDVGKFEMGNENDSVTMLSHGLMLCTSIVSARRA